MWMWANFSLLVYRCFQLTHPNTYANRCWQYAYIWDLTLSLWQRTKADPFQRRQTEKKTFSSSAANSSSPSVLGILTTRLLRRLGELPMASSKPLCFSKQAEVSSAKQIYDAIRILIMRQSDPPNATCKSSKFYLSKTMPCFCQDN